MGSPLQYPHYSMIGNKHALLLSRAIYKEMG